MFHTLHYDFKSEQNKLLMYLQKLQTDKRNICIMILEWMTSNDEVK